MKKYEIWLQGGYTGGHTSQSSWDNEVEDRAVASIQKAFPDMDVRGYANEGNTSGYYPSVVLVATEEQLQQIKNLISRIDEIKVLEETA
jgi:hypothetical protein